MHQHRDDQRQPTSSTPAPENDTSGATETPQQRRPVPDQKSVSNPTPNVGEQITFTVRLTNSGPSGASGIQVTDLLPAGPDLRVVERSQPGDVRRREPGLWDDRHRGQRRQTPQTLTITATVVTAFGRPDQLGGHNRQRPVRPRHRQRPAPALTETPQLRFDLLIAKAVSDPTPNVGETITYSLAVANSGPDTATGVVVTDLLPAGVTFVSADRQPGRLRRPHRPLDRGHRRPRRDADLTITVTVNRDRPDRQYRDRPRRSVRPEHGKQHRQHHDRSAGRRPVARQDRQRPDAQRGRPDYLPRSTLSNTGPHEATGVQVTDLLPAGVTFVSASRQPGEPRRRHRPVGPWARSPPARPRR